MQEYLIINMKTQRTFYQYLNRLTEIQRKVHGIWHITLEHGNHRHLILRYNVFPKFI